MVDFQSIDDRASLAGTNRLELLLFKLANPRDVDGKALYGINVFKVRELMVVPELMRLPGSHPCVAGMANIRGRAVPVIDLGRYCGFPGGGADSSNILVITEFNNSTQGFLVDGVENILQLAWSDIREPPEMVSHNHDNMLTAMSSLEDGRMLLIIDVERVIADVLGTALDAETELAEIDDSRLVFFADDSGVARAQVAKILDRMQLQHRSAENGEDAFNALVAMADEAERQGKPLSDTLLAIVTDVEMPRMDGYVLTGKLKSDRRFDGIPVMMHSSLSSSENERLGMHVGADGYMSKLQPREFSRKLAGLITGTHPDISIQELPPAA